MEFTHQADLNAWVKPASPDCPRSGLLPLPLEGKTAPQPLCAPESVRPILREQQP